MSVPDFIANAGGVICGAVEYAGGTATDAFATIEEKVRENVCQVLEMATREQVMPATAAMQLARQRIIEAGGYRRRF